MILILAATGTAGRAVDEPVGGAACTNRQATQRGISSEETH
jgi:hypothetical protein